MIQLSTISTRPPAGLDKDEIEDLTKDYAKRLSDLHQVLKAEKKHNVLVILQGMDASGKDGAVKSVFKYCTHNNIFVHSFKKPTELEFAHDFLWRAHKICPAQGEIRIWNRSHYEEVLIQRVHKWVSEETIDARFEAINDFEKLLSQHNNTHIFKFYLHLSHAQQELELQERIDEKDKNFKHNPNDWKEREHWDEYMRCYEDVLNRSTIPWTIVPVDERWYRNYIIAKTLVEGLEKLNMQYPGLEKE